MIRRKIRMTRLAFIVIILLSVVMVTYVKGGLNDISTCVELNVVNGESEYLDDLLITTGYCDNGTYYADEGDYEVYKMSHSLEFDNGSALVSTDLGQGEFVFKEKNYDIWLEYNYEGKGKDGLYVVNGEELSADLYVSDWGSDREYEFKVNDFVQFSADSEMVFYSGEGDECRVSLELAAYNLFDPRFHLCKLGDTEYMYFGNMIYLEYIAIVTEYGADNSEDSIEYMGRDEIEEVLKNISDKKLAEQLKQLELPDISGSVKGGIYQVNDGTGSLVYPLEDMDEDVSVMNITGCESENALILYGRKGSDAIAYIYYLDTGRCEEVVVWEAGDLTLDDDEAGLEAGVMVNENIVTFMIYGSDVLHITSLKLGETIEKVYDYDVSGDEDYVLNRFWVWGNSGIRPVALVDGDLIYICKSIVDARDMMSIYITVFDKGVAVFQGSVSMRTGDTYSDVLWGGSSTQYNEMGDWSSITYSDSLRLKDFSLDANRCDSYLTGGWIDIKLKE
ncbi:MAG: hypothetical protein IJZ25_02395 [Lachnospiraceae bacterium]|nr:hypothetical protein [Lachnospiraceae bacterium]